MLELQAGGRCMSGLDAIEFFENLGDMIDEEVRTEEFCQEMTEAINRLRFEVRKSIPCPVNAHNGKFTNYTCGQCGSVTKPDIYKFCPQCGRKIQWKEPSHA